MPGSRLARLAFILKAVLGRFIVSLYSILIRYPIMGFWGVPPVPADPWPCVRPVSSGQPAHRACRSPVHPVTLPQIGLQGAARRGLDRNQKNVLPAEVPCRRLPALAPGW